MTKTLAEELANIAVTKDSLDEATVRLNALLTRAEKVFASLRLGVSASIELRRDAVDWVHYLRFAKDAGEWRFIVSSGIGQQCADTPLLKASRELRFYALEKLPELHKALCAEADRQTCDIKDKVSSAHAFLDSLEKVDEPVT